MKRLFHRKHTFALLINQEKNRILQHLKKYFIDKAKVNLWWAEADEGVVIPGWSKTASKRSGLLLGKEDEVEKQLKQNGLVLVVSEWKGGSRYKKTRRRRRQTRRLHSNLVKRKN